MYVFCKRTFIFSENYKWSKNKWYDSVEPVEHQSGIIYLYIYNDIDTPAYPLSKNTFSKYFYTIRELRDIKLKKII
jgi:hypothetical protein